MNKQLETKLKKIKQVLDDDLSYIDLAYIEEKSSKFLIDDCKTELDLYHKFKNKYDDLWFGDVIFWVDEDTFKKRQIYIMMYNVPNPEEWICIGEVQPYPLLINKKTGIINCVINEPGLDCEMKEYVKFEEFMDKYVLGEKYLELGTDEEWYEFMKEHQII